MRNLKIERPLVFLDLETTGLSIATARVVEISFLKILPDGEEQSLTSLINPANSLFPKRRHLFMA
jgi:DNA polymerase-3 subunit epsilon